jgi:molybdenum cofactor guanylyltransferase
MNSHKSYEASYSDHPMEIAILGFYDSEKAIFIRKLLTSMSRDFSISYINHNNHSNQWKKDRAETEEFLKWGANSVSMIGEEQDRILFSGETDYFQNKTQYLKSDLVFLDTLNYSNFSGKKIVIFDKKGKVLNFLSKEDMTNVVAFIGEGARPKALSDKIPFLQNENIQAIQDLLVRNLENSLKERPLYGLVLTAGYSSRMGTDKALLSYHGKPQLEVCNELLQDFCKKVFISCRREQWKNISSMNELHDRFEGLGPLGGILTAMTTYPEAAFLTISCDLPFLDKETLLRLVSERNPYKMAIAFFHKGTGLPEPLCSIYEPKSIARLMEGVALALPCPRKLFLHSPVQKLSIFDSRPLKNINFRKDYEAVKKEILTCQSNG